MINVCIITNLEVNVGYQKCDDTSIKYRINEEVGIKI